LPDDDRIPVRINENTISGITTAVDPVVQYGHVKCGGDAVGSGFVYRRRTILALRGKYVFGDITTSNLWYADYQEMLAADDGGPRRMAAMHPLKILWNKPKGGKELYGSMAPITDAAAWRPDCQEPR